MPEERCVKITPFRLAQRFIGMKEVPGAVNNSQIMAMLRLDDKWPEGDEVPWCSAFVNYICWLLRLPRSKSLLARSWLDVGRVIDETAATPGFDIVILGRSGGDDPEDRTSPGHVGFFAGHLSRGSGTTYLLGGNQSDTVNISGYRSSRILGVRRLL